MGVDQLSETGDVSPCRFLQPGPECSLETNARLTPEGKLHFVQVRAHISYYFFGDLVGGAAINSAFRLALSCSTAARTKAIA
jgi:hypothetical protein